MASGGESSSRDGESLTAATGTRDCVYSGKFLQYIIAREAERVSRRAVTIL